MTIQHVILGVLIISAILGVVLIGSVSTMYLREHKVGQGGIILTFVGLMLLGLSVWQSFEFSAGQVKLSANSALSSIQRAQTIAQSSTALPASSFKSCQEERDLLRLALVEKEHELRQVNEILSGAMKELHDIAMTPIRNIR